MVFDVILAIIGIWAVQELFSISFYSITNLVPDIICSSVCNNVWLVRCLIIFAMLLQVRGKHKWYKVMDDINEVPYDQTMTHEDKLRKCDLGISYSEGRKEVILFEKDLIKSLSPLPM